MEKIPSSILPYLEEIAQCLWSRNASIMIGAGFSMNAEAIFENAKRFPMWQDLGNVFYKKVRGAEITSAEYNFFDPLKLAYEVEANFGRSVLDSILRNTIPDSEYKPSELHLSLLNLPWTDVFTTNYDTLLERAADLVSQRNYKVIVNKDNLVHSVPPRIIKLHGCFSASTPLIISEEDYRTYPQKYAPFVNTVQQTLLENTLCLIGFSGDDPNFLKWIGWIRDNLGAQNAPKIYLIGVLNLSTSQEKALSQYNITCVDMSLCQGVGTKDHQAGIKTFISYCESKKDDESKKGWKLSNRLSQSPVESKGNLSSDDINNLTELVSLWKEERCLYPNWLIAPYELRRKLWANTSDWSSILDKKISAPPPILRDFIYEFLWRKEKSLLPIFDNEIELIWSTINLDFDEKINLNEKTFYIVLSLLRYYREEGKKESWNELFNLANKYFTGQNNIDYLTYEKALQLLFENKNIELTHLLSRWESGNSSTIWLYRKASILAEINKLTDAKECLEKALIKTRRKINSGLIISDFSNVSLEAYILVLLTYINHALLIQEDQWNFEFKNEYLERLDDLKQYQCNPKQEILLLEFEIKHEPNYISPITISNGFDIGSRRTTHHFSYVDDELLNAFRLLRFFEDASLPFSLPRIKIAVTGANNAIKRAAKYAPHWSMCTMLRTRDKKSIELIFTRESLSNLDTNFINRLAENYIGLLSDYVNDEDSLYEYGLVLPEALSRLCCRLSLIFKDKTLELVEKIYANNPSRLKYQSINELVKRLIFSYSDKEIAERIEKITHISYYIIANDGKAVDQHLCPNPFDYFNNSVINAVKNKKTKLKLPVDLLRSHLESIESDNNEVRINACITLINIYNLGLLNKNQIRSLLSKLLTHLDKYGLPRDTGYLKFSYLELFNGKSNIEKCFRNYILDLAPLIQTNASNPKSYGISGRADIFTRELVGSSEVLQWSDEELLVHAQKLLNWWEADKIIFEEKQNRNDITSEIKTRFSLFIESLDTIIFKNNLIQYNERVKHIVFDFKNIGLNYLYLKATAIKYIAFDNDLFFSEIEYALSSSKEQETIDALKAIDKLLLNSKDVDFRYLGALNSFIKYSRGHYLSSAFQIVSNLLKSKLNHLITPLESTVLIALSRANEGYQSLDFEENLELKKIAAKLAFELNRYYLLHTEAVPPIISTWSNICNSEDTFSEIKNQWEK